MKLSVNLSGLNDKQKEAVVSSDRISLIIAGPGAGKTKVLTTKICYLIADKGVLSENILALTFTNKAADEMKKRISGLINIDIRNTYIGTFHSCFVKILRKNCGKLGYSSNFTIYDSADVKSLVKSIVNKLNLDLTVYSPNIIAERISLMKSRLITAEIYKDNDDYLNQDIKNGISKFADIYLDYSKKCKENNVMDFDDLLLNIYILFSENNDILSFYQKKFRYILIDEFQDTNVVQYEIIKKLMTRDTNLFVVGDDSQSIYSFRGATVSNILNFKNDFKECKVIKLEQNYRSTKNIIAISNEIIKNNKEKINKSIWTDNKDGDECKMLHSRNGLEEAKLVSLVIKKLIDDKKYKPSDIVILYRMNSQARLFETELSNKSIGYKIVGGISFYQCEEIKDILAFFRVILNTNDSEAIKRTINTPRRGIGDTTMSQVYKLSEEEGIKLWDIFTMSRTLFGTRIAELLQRYVSIVEPLIKDKDKKNAYEIASELCEKAGFLKYYKEIAVKDPTPYENILCLLNSIKMFVEDKDNSDKSLSAYLQNLQLDSDELMLNESKDNERVSLMTVHSVKGLEFKCVFIVGLEEGIFPIVGSNMSGLEEERRLFYVAVTRAEESLYLSYASTRYYSGKNNESKKSRFISEIDSKISPDTITMDKFKNLKSEDKNSHPSYSMFKFSIVSRKINEKNTVVQGDIKSSANVFHSVYGVGKVISVCGPSNNLVRVCFPGHGEKTLVKERAKLVVVFSE